MNTKFATKTNTTNTYPMKPERFFLYARKSTESEDRQVQSIENQIESMKRVAERENLKIAKVFKESKSAKSPNIRSVFSEMIHKIEKGEAQGLLCWAIDRISRNPVDSGKISWLLQQGIIKVIRTNDRVYHSEDNALLLDIENSMANQYIRDLSKKVRWGNDKKIKDGGWPGLAPMGYKNRLEDHLVVPDPERFPLIRKAWDLMLTGAIPVPRILHKLNNEWGFRTLKRKHSGGFPMAISGLYGIFNNPFYKGTMLYNGQEYKGNHQPMISVLEFDRVQVLLGNKAKCRVRKNDFKFTGQIHCAECGCIITAEKKFKDIKSTGEHREYIYYHCTRKKPGVNCSQKRAITEKALENQIVNFLEEITILPEFREWAIDVLKIQHQEEVHSRQKVYESQQRQLNELEQKRDKLMDHLLNDVISEDEFSTKKKELEKNINLLREQIENTEDRADEWFKAAEGVFNLATYGKQNFLEGTLETKRTILTALGQNQTLLDGKLQITPFKWLAPIIKEYPSIEKRYLTSEPTKYLDTAVQNVVLAPIISDWQGRKDSNLE